jgi:hypothetical protein
MRTYRNLYSQVCAFENLYRAYWAARKGTLAPRLRAKRASAGERVQKAALDFQELNIAAGKTRGAERRTNLLQADIWLAQLKH